MTFLLFLLGGARKLLTGLWAWLKDLTGWQLACIALALFAGVQTYRTHTIAKERDTALASVAKLIDASERAGVAATNAKHAEETRTLNIAKDADNALDTARDDAARQLAAYVRLHRNPASPPRNSDLPGPASAPEVDNGTGGTATVDESVLAVCTRNTVRLNNAHGWGAALVTPTKDQ